MEDFEDMRRALNTLNFPVDDQKSLLDSIAAVLHLGQLEFEADNSGSEEGEELYWYIYMYNDNRGLNHPYFLM